MAQSFSGQVLDVSNQPIEAVSVSIVDANNIGLCFTICEDDGSFRLSCEDIGTAKYIHFSRLGYESKKIDINSFRNGSKITLAQSEIRLNEVIVRYQPITQRGDTLNYDVSGFRLAQDRSIKDVLRRLPGIEVGESGRIKYQGKEINKFLVENLDLTDGRYNLVSNNLASKAVKTVQVLENHQPISALRDTEFTDRAALNLVLEDDARGKLLGSIDLGAGIENSIDNLIWENRAMGMLFGKSLQEISVYKNANNGMDIKEDLIDFGTGTSFRSGVGERNIFNALGVANNTGFAKKRYFFNDSHFFSTNTLVKVGEDKILRIQASYLHEKEKQRMENSTLYLLPENTLYITERTRVGNLANQIEGRLTYESNAEKAYLKNTLKVNSVFATNNGSIAGTENVQQTTDLDKLTMSNEFNLVKKFDGDKAFKFNSVNEFNGLPQQIAIYPGLYQRLMGEDITDKHLVQHATLQSFNTHSFTSFSHSLAGLNVEYNLGLNLKTQLLKSSPDDDTSTLLATYTDSLSNHYRFTETNFYLSPTFRFQREYLKISLVLNSTLKHLYKNDFLKDDPKRDKTIFLVQPALSLNYDINAFWKFSISSQYRKNYADIHSLFSGYILRSYRNALNHDDALTYQTALSNTLSMSYKNPIKGLFINFGGVHSLQGRNNLTNTTFNGIFQQSSSINKNVTDKNMSAYFNLSKTLPYLSSVVDFKYYYSSSDHTQFLYEELTKNNTTTHNLNLSLTLAPIKKLNIEGGGTLSFSQLKTVFPEVREYSPIRDYKFELAINLLPNDKINFSFRNDLYYNNIENSSFAYFSDISVSYKMKKNEIQLLANNIFNETKYEKWSLGSFSRSHYLTFLRERQILVKYMFNF